MTYSGGLLTVCLGSVVESACLAFILTATLKDSEFCFMVLNLLASIGVAGCDACLVV